MEETQFSRTELIIGKKNSERIKSSKVAVFGIGGVGSFVVEGLVRAGISNFILVDNDTISISNINRQLHSTYSTIGKDKVEIMKERILDINPSATVETFKTFFMPGAKEEIFNDSIDYVVDAVDTITAKIEIILQSKKLDIPVISCMGTGNKLNPTMFEVADIYETTICPLAKTMRKELRRRNIDSLKVVYSKELPIKTENDLENTENKKRTPGSISFVPSVAGMIIASEVIKDIIK